MNDKMTASALAIWFLKDSELWLLRVLVVPVPVALRTRTVLERVPPPAEPPATLTQTCIRLCGLDQL